jgi:large subunit ribosomal protein L44e
MKLPKEVNRFCPTCRKHTTHAVATSKQKSRSATHPLSRGSSAREKLRGLLGKMGNLGRRSRKGPKDWKRKTKVTKRLTVTYKCKVCGKMHMARSGWRVGRIEIGEKVSK